MVISQGVHTLAVLTPVEKVLFSHPAVFVLTISFYREWTFFGKT